MKNKPIEVRIPYGIGARIKAEAFRLGTHEYAVFCLISHAETSDKTLVLVRDIFTLREDQYVSTFLHGAMWRGSSTLELLNQGITRKLGIAILHAHEHRGKVGLSSDDMQSAQQVLPSYQNLIPDRPHASIVLGEEHAAGIVLMPGTSHFESLFRVRWLDKAIVDWDDYSFLSRPGIDPLYSRQVLLIGTRGQSLLRGAKVAVVGLSGGGSHVVQQAAHLGVGEIIGIDPDIAEEENRHRVIGLHRRDILFKRKKTLVMSKLVQRINSKVKFTPVPNKIPEKPAIDQLKRADIVIGCVDNLFARSDIQELCLRYLIPYVDIGLLITPNQDGTSGQSIGGNVITIIPGHFCMWCTGVISDKKLEDETGGRPRSYFQGSDKQAQVVSFNGLLASSAVNEMLQLITGFAPVDDFSVFKKFNGLTGTLEEWLLKPSLNCSVCKAQVAAGDTVWTKA